MRNRLRGWLNDVPIDDPIVRQQVALTQVILLGLISIFAFASVLTLLAPLLVASISYAQVLHSAIANGMAVLLLAAPLSLLRLGHFRLAVLFLMIFFILLPGYIAASQGLSDNVALLLCTIPITLAALVLGRRALLLTLAATIAVVSIAAVWQRLGHPQFDSTAIIINFMLITSVLALFLDRFGVTLRDALEAALTREQELEQSRAALQARTHELEREVRARTQIEQALRESEERYRLIAEHSNDLISLLDLDDAGQRVYISPSYQAVLGYDPAELLGPQGVSLIHPDDLNTVVEQFARIAAGGSARATYRLRHADGSWRWIETQASAIVQKGRSYAVAVGRDVAERKQLEAQLMQSQRLESVGRLAGGVAHDFNNLLTAIMGNTELARDSLPAGHPARADLDEIAKSAARAAELTRQLLAFARKQIIEPHAIDLNQLILDMDKLLRRLIGAHIDLIVLTDPDLWRVRADRGQIEQIVVNLAINARDAMAGGGTLTIETRNMRLDHDYAHRHISVSPGCYVMLAVSDTGTGMDEQTQAQIFEPFFTTKAPGRGTGLGLATCYGIVKQHGGSIWPYSEPGHGSTFKVYLPRVEAPAEVQTLPAEDDNLPRGTETILLAEDEPSVRMLSARVLRAQGYRVVVAENGDAALQLARAWDGPPLDLLLTDVVMPRMSGKTLAEHIQALHPASGVLFISGYTDNAIVHHGQLDPGIVFLQKPFSPAALARKVREVLDSRAG